MPPLQNCHVFVDKRERASGLFDLLARQPQVTVAYTHLSAGDYLINEEL